MDNIYIYIYIYGKSTVQLASVTLAQAHPNEYALIDIFIYTCNQVYIYMMTHLLRQIECC